MYGHRSIYGYRSRNRNRSRYSYNGYRNSYLHRGRYNAGRYPSNTSYYGPPRRRGLAWRLDYDRERRRRMSIRARMRRERRRTRRDGSDRESSSSRDNSPEPPKPEPKPEPPKEEIAKKLKISTVNMHVTKNAEDHKTDKFASVYKESEPVLRRGNTFNMTLETDRKFTRKNDDLRIKLSYGEHPVAPKGTLVELDVDETIKEIKFGPFQWGAQVVKVDDKSIDIKVSIPANCIVGIWNLSVVTTAEGKDAEGKDVEKQFIYEHSDDVTILFNPWCEHDLTFMKDADLLEEYVLNDTGLVYKGTQHRPYGKPWNFGQFEEVCLDVSLFLLRKSCAKLHPRSMANPVIVSRRLAAAVNAQDDDGVLTGNWSGNYEGGTSPSEWSGSVKILEQFNNNQAPVSYGQCWVFSGVLNTVCRALGIPCRSVTNFSSAHDTDGSLTIEKIHTMQDGKFKLDKYHTKDSVWNFHVWNEVWLQRPDLADPQAASKKNFCDGWQIIDSTPQEQSDKIGGDGACFTCGPAPLTAIKEGKCTLGYDTGFVFAEVNSDIVNLGLMPQGGVRVLRKIKDGVGKKISTKAVGEDNDDRQDLTLDYKYPEGSKEEREAVKNAWRGAGGEYHDLVFDDEREIMREIELEVEYSWDTYLGQDLEVKVIIKNPGQHVRKGELLVTFTPEKYTGYGVGETFFTHESKHKIQSKGEETVNLTSTFNEYWGKLFEMYMVKIFAKFEAYPLAGAVPDFPVIEEPTPFRFRTPDLRIECDRVQQLNEMANIHVGFTNPLNIPLTKCKLTAESSVGFDRMQDVNLGDIGAGDDLRTQVSVKSNRKGKYTITFVFQSLELKDIQGRVRVVVKDNTDERRGTR